MSLRVEKVNYLNFPHKSHSLIDSNWKIHEIFFWGRQTSKQNSVNIKWNPTHVNLKMYEGIKEQISFYYSSLLTCTFWIQLYVRVYLFYRKSLVNPPQVFQFTKCKLSFWISHSDVSHFFQYTCNCFTLTLWK